VSDQPPPFEYQKWTHELNVRRGERAHDSASDFAAKANVAAIENGNLAMRTAVLINGGAVVTVLAFIGALASREKVTGQHLIQLASTLVYFAFGVVAATVAMGFAYATNYCIAGQLWSHERKWEHPYVVPTPRSRAWWWVAIIFHVLAILAVLGSLVLFVCGVFEVKNAITNHLV